MLMRNLQEKFEVVWNTVHKNELRMKLFIPVGVFKKKWYQFWKKPTKLEDTEKIIIEVLDRHKEKINSDENFVEFFIPVKDSTEINIGNYDINDLEERCRKANFSPYDDRLPVHDYEFEWDEHTIKIAEDWLKQHHPELAK